ncbi:MAG: hypothetical protein VZR09_00655 [Candidatus Gastranaerophilaceae bacterium]|nr:hypothetical protein [Candidatus Gastranaerophilaceae bacterium]
MVKKSAMGAIGMLITLFIIALLFITLMPALKDAGGASIHGTSLDKKSVESRVQQQVSDIEAARKMSQDYTNRVNQEDY